MYIWADSQRLNRSQAARDDSTICASEHSLLPTMPRFPIHRLTIVGAGTMGSWIAIAALRSGAHVTLIDAYFKSLERVSVILQREDMRQETHGCGPHS